MGSTRYADDGFMVNLYTEEGGMVAAVRTGRRSRVRMSHIQPLTLLDVCVGGRPSQGVRSIQECCVRCSPVGDGSAVKVMVAQFLAEVLGRVLRGYDAQDGVLFEFIYSSIERYAGMGRGVANFHLFFLIKLTYFLGIFPNTESWGEGAHFDFTRGEFVDRVPMHGYHLSRGESVDLANLLRTSYDNMYLWELSREERNVILDHIISYYGIHAVDISGLRSIEILRSL